MDKWKDIELEKMKVGGNRNAREFLEDQPVSLNAVKVVLRDQILNTQQRLLTFLLLIFYT